MASVPVVARTEIDYLKPARLGLGNLTHLQAMIFTNNQGFHAFLQSNTTPSDSSEPRASIS